MKRIAALKARITKLKIKLCYLEVDLLEAINKRAERGLKKQRRRCRP